MMINIYIYINIDDLVQEILELQTSIIPSDISAPIVALLRRPLRKHVGQKRISALCIKLKGKKRYFQIRVKFGLLIAEFAGDYCMQDCSLNGIAFIQMAPHS